MGISLHRKGESSMDLGAGAWGSTLRLGRDHGWKPLGCKDILFDHKVDRKTGRQRKLSWKEIIVIEGNYGSGGIVGEADATNLAKALEKAVHEWATLPVAWKTFIEDDIHCVKIIAMYVGRGEFYIT